MERTHPNERAPVVYDVEFNHVTKTFAGAIAVADLSLRVARGAFFSLLGPSGCGKTTTLRLIAGFEQPDSGQILIGDADVAGLPPYRRDCNTVFQSYSLFPHMSVAENIAYGLRQKRLKQADIARRVEEALVMVRLPGAGARRPSQLSGGQQQRVALARALVNRPTVLLLDEPLSALDLKLRKEMQGELKALQRAVGITFIYVTHDQEEAITLSDQIAVMHGGHIEQLGAPAEIYDRPVTRFVADFIGLTNFIPATVRQAQWTPEGEAEIVVATALGDVACAGRQPQVTVGEQVTLTLRPEKIQALPAGEQPDSDWNVVEGAVSQATYLGPQTEYLINVPTAGGEPGALLTIRQQNTAGAGAIGGEDPEQGHSASLQGFRPGERLILAWRREASLILQESPARPTDLPSREPISRSTQPSRV